MVGRADIEESKNNVALNARLPQASYPCGNFSDTLNLKITKHRTLGSIGHAFTFDIFTKSRNQTNIYPYILNEISVHIELIIKDTNVIL